MRKTIAETAIATDGKVGAYIEDGDVVVAARYPVKKLAEPVLKAMEPLKAKLEALIPGDWENPLVDKAFEAIEAEILSVIVGLSK